MQNNKIKGLKLFEHSAYADDRGFYTELNIIPEIEKETKNKFYTQQINLSYSKKNVIRGFHAEDWNKLATVITGKAFCAFADLRPNSPSFSQTQTITLDASVSKENLSVFIPKGVANSFLVLEGPVNYLYCVDELYTSRDKKNDKAISLFDPDLNIKWPIAKEKMIMSNRDKNSITLRELFPSKF
ncbi:MAG: dTDP-4-dehydrorhamnose 3,5-epimerase family protein [Patescibacteria group bacterium]